MDYDCKALKALKPPTEVDLRDAWMSSRSSLVLHKEEVSQDDHGYAFTRIFYRSADNSYWRFTGVSQGGGRYDTLRDDASPDVLARQVYPYKVTVTKFKDNP